MRGRVGSIKDREPFILRFCEQSNNNHQISYNGKNLQRFWVTYQPQPQALPEKQQLSAWSVSVNAFSHQHQQPSLVFSSSHQQAWNPHRSHLQPHHHLEHPNPQGCQILPRNRYTCGNKNEGYLPPATPKKEQQNPQVFSYRDPARVSPHASSLHASWG
ncbi:hypothetical protein HanIR_Chr08g0362141 [Helianthus annuus]|nr:hypothetical protein HanIR_Chr08g0362141 [Helianthus annuus]